MKKTGKWVLLVLLIVCAAGFTAYYFLSHRGLDTAAPTISFEQEELALSVHDGQAALLRGVTATDDTDGDVTDSLVVEGVSSIRPDHTATVTYAAFDRAGHVTKAQRTIRYTDYHRPTFALSAPLLFRSGASVDIYQYLTALDLVDGDVSDKIKATLVGGEGNISQDGVHPVEVRVTNSMGDTARITLPVEVYPNGVYNATLELTEYLVYVEKGASFSTRDYLSTLLAGSGTYDLTKGLPQGAALDVDSDVVTGSAGCYSVTYTLTYGSYKAYTRLIVIVEDPEHA